MKDSPNGKRYGKRDPKGRIVEAYGFDLVADRRAPCRIRAGWRRRGGRSACAMGRLRRRATIARKGIVQILETAAEYGFEGEEWQMLARDMAALARALRDVERLDEMELGRHQPRTPANCGARASGDPVRSSGFRPQGGGKPAPL